MIEWVVIIAASLMAATLTFFSGFGLGTLLMPAFAFFFPLPIAVAATAVVHLANNLFKVALVRRHTHPATFLRFGLPAIIAAFGGALLLEALEGMPTLASWVAMGRTHEVRPVALAVGLVMIAFAITELHPRFHAWSFHPRWLPVGGIISGFFGGLSGHQGALRTAFLTRLGLTKEQLIATGAACALAVDLARLAVYGVALRAILGDAGQRPDLALLAVACAAAFLGSYLGSRMLTKVTLPTIRRVIGVMLLVLGAAIASGVM